MSLTCHIDLFNSQTCTGWVIVGAVEQLDLACMIDGEMISVKTFSIKRNDIVVQEGECAFGFDFDWKLKDNVEYHLIIQTIEGDQVLFDVQGKWTEGRWVQSEPIYHFLHIPKTAGTTFRNTLVRQFADSQVYPNNYLLRNNVESYFNLAQIKSVSKSRLSRTKLICGHYPYGVRNVATGEVRSITFLREPESRLISHARHLRRMNNACAGRSVINMKEELGIHVLDNTMVRYLCQSDLDNQRYKTTKKVGQEEFELAVNNLQSMFFAGAVENYDQDLMRLSALTGWSLNSPEKINVTPNTTDDNELDVLNEYESLIYWDKLLYFECQRISYES